MATLPTPAEVTSNSTTNDQMKSYWTRVLTYLSDLLGADSANKAAARAALGVLLASTEQEGLIELATAAEVQEGTDATRAVTPAGLASRTATETRAGIVELATSAEAQALASATLALTPARLADAFKGANQSLAMRGYQRLPGGLLLQWGRDSATVGTNGSITFPLAFGGLFTYVAAPEMFTGSGYVFRAHGPSSTGFSYGWDGWSANGNGINCAINWVAIGTIV